MIDAIATGDADLDFNSDAKNGGKGSWRSVGGDRDKEKSSSRFEGLWSQGKRGQGRNGPAPGQRSEGLSSSSSTAVQKPFRYSREELLSFYRPDASPPSDFTFVDKITSRQPFFPVAFQPEDPEVQSFYYSVNVLLISHAGRSPALSCFPRSSR